MIAAVEQATTSLSRIADESGMMDSGLEYSSLQGYSYVGYFDKTVTSSF